MTTDAPVAFITGGAQRIGAEIARTFHRHDFRIIVHYRRSDQAARSLVDECNALRANSAVCLHADLTRPEQVSALSSAVLKQFNRLDVLVNNASSYYPTPFGSIQQHQWDDLIDSNLRAALFLAQALAPELGRNSGAIVNIVDSHIAKPLKHHSVYSIAKAGVYAMTQALAQELAPAVRVNGISPGAILWPSALADTADSAVLAARQKILEQIPLGKTGQVQHIAAAVFFLAVTATYITGTIVRVDGGRSLNL